MDQSIPVIVLGSLFLVGMTYLVLTWLYSPLPQMTEEDATHPPK